MTPARHKAECLRPIAKAELDEVRRFLLANCVETYIELDEEGQREYEALMSENENREVQAMEMTWAEKLEARGVERGIEQGIEQGIERGRKEGVQQLQTLVLNQMKRRFGSVPATTERKVRRIESAERLSRLGEQLFEARNVEELEL
ncbi:MAG TPA: DUF4351 domain-containing protein [Thermoanaerobaculia bacterium]|nr:DUF4351 domain-containing protein [Thermoanaerobaculia bacterium]